MIFQDNTLRTPRIFSASLESCKPMTWVSLRSLILRLKLLRRENLKSTFTHSEGIATSSDAWAESLAKDIMISLSVKLAGTYALKKESQYADVLAKEPLLMPVNSTSWRCDQIEAELACREVGMMSRQNPAPLWITPKSALDSQLLD